MPPPSSEPLLSPRTPRPPSPEASPFPPLDLTFVTERILSVGVPGVGEGGPGGHLRHLAKLLGARHGPNYTVRATGGGWGALGVTGSTGGVEEAAGGTGSPGEGGQDTREWQGAGISGVPGVGWGVLGQFRGRLGGSGLPPTPSVSTQIFNLSEKCRDLTRLNPKVRRGPGGSWRL